MRRRAQPSVSRSQAAGWRRDHQAQLRERLWSVMCAEACESDGDEAAARHYREKAARHADAAARILGTLRRFNAEFAR